MTKPIAYLTLALAVGFAASPLFTTPFSGFRPDQLPIPQVNPPVQPAGYAFAVWGLLYAWLIISAVFGVVRRSGAQDWHRARLPLSVSLAVGVPWLAIAGASAIWASVAIVIMAAAAIRALLHAPARDRWWFQAPTALYAGWLTAASCVSIATTAAGYGLLTGGTGWACIGIIAGLIVASATYLRRPQAPEYLATVIWALIGIVVANGTALPLVSGLAALGIVALTGLSLQARLRSPAS